MSLPRYPEYKSSGVGWIADIPEHWNIISIKRIVSTPITDGPHETPMFLDEGVPFVSAEAVSGGFINFDKIRGHITRDDHLRYGEKYLPKRNDIYMVKSGATTGVTAIVETDIEFNIWSPLAAIRCDTRMADPHFVLRALQARGFQEGIALHWSFGTQQNIGMGVLGDLPIALPPISEQTAIAAFLDRETAKIDGLIAEQEKLIALLAEKRQATISHAVTRGLNPDAPMKDSGVPWLGEVPEHWALTPLARIALDRCDGPFGSGIKSEHYTEEGALVVRLQNIRAGAFNRGEPVYLDESYFLDELQGHDVAEGDLLVAGLGDDNNLLGRACVAPAGLGLALVKADCFRFRLDAQRANSEFVAWQLSAGAAYDAGVLATGTTRSRIPLSTMASRKIMLPPLGEQEEIAAFIARESNKLDTLRGEADRAILLLKERRSALIAAAVTGQIDVRAAFKPSEVENCCGLADGEGNGIISPEIR